MKPQCVFPAGVTARIDGAVQFLYDEDSRRTISENLSRHGGLVPLLVGFASSSIPNGMARIEARSDGLWLIALATRGDWLESRNVAPMYLAGGFVVSNEPLTPRHILRVSSFDLIAEPGFAGQQPIEFD